MSKISLIAINNSKLCFIWKRKRARERAGAILPQTRGIGKREEMRACVDIGPIGGSATPTLYKSLFLPATCSVFQFERRGCVRSSGISLVRRRPAKWHRSHTMLYWEKISSLRCCCGLPPLLSSPWYVSSLIWFHALSSRDLEDQWVRNKTREIALETNFFFETRPLVTKNIRLIKIRA